MAKKFKTKEGKEIPFDYDGRVSITAASNELLVKRLVPEARLPTRGHPNDAGLDLYAASEEKDPQGRFISYGTGIAVAIPEGYVGLLFQRSSISNTALSLRNAVGVLDSGYQGEISFRYRKIDGCKGAHYFNVGDRIGQLVIIPCLLLEPTEAAHLPPSSRGTGGYGSTGV